MNDFMQKAYVFLWGALAVLMFIIGIKQCRAARLSSEKRHSAVAFLLSAFFVFMTVWYGLRSFCGYKMFDGTLGIVFKCITGAFLLLLIGIYILMKLQDGKNNLRNSEPDNDE